MNISFGYDNIYIEFRMVDGETYILHVCKKHYDDYSYLQWLYDQLKDDELDEWVEYTEHGCSSDCDICNNKKQGE